MTLNSPLCLFSFLVGVASSLRREKVSSLQKPQSFFFWVCWTDTLVKNSEHRPPMLIPHSRPAAKSKWGPHYPHSSCPSCHIMRFLKSKAPRKTTTHTQIQARTQQIHIFFHKRLFCRPSSRNTEWRKCFFFVSKHNFNICVWNTGFLEGPENSMAMLINWCPCQNDPSEI